MDVENDVNNHCTDCGSELEMHGDRKYYCTGDDPLCHVMYVRKDRSGKICRVIREAVSHDVVTRELILMANGSKGWRK